MELWMENNIIPVYWVDENNIASVKLVKKVDVKVVSEEIVVGTD
jgi:hypothetical protein